MKKLLQRVAGVASLSPPAAAGPSARRLWWGGLFFSSLVAMGSTFEAVRMQRYVSPQETTAAQRWAVASSTTAFLLSFASLAAQSNARSASLLSGTKLELALILAATAAACASAGAATNPATGMAVNSTGGVSFGNLYFSTWMSFGCSFALLLSFLRTERGLDVASELKSRGNRFRLWAILIVVTLIVMGSSASSYDARCGDIVERIGPRNFCRRAAFGVSAGCIGCVGSLAIVAMRLACTKSGRPNEVIFFVECMGSVVLLCFYSFAVAYLTSEQGPGAPLGNIYYSAWITFGLVLFVSVSCFEEFQAAKVVYSLQHRQGSDVSEVDLLSTINDNSSGHGGSVDWRVGKENNVSGPEPRLPAQAAIPPEGKRSSSVGEITLAD